MAGSPHSAALSLTGADVVSVTVSDSSLFPSQGYSIAATLGVGHGVFAFSFMGGIQLTACEDIVNSRVLWASLESQIRQLQSD